MKVANSVSARRFLIHRVLLAGVYCSLSFYHLTLLKGFLYSTSRVWFCFNCNQCKWRQTAGLRLKSNWHIYLMFIFFLCSWKPIFLLIHKSWCSACQGQYTHSPPKLRLEPNLTPCKGVCIPEYKNLEYSSRNPESKFYWQKSGIQYLESEIHGVESRIQDCLVFLYMGRKIPCASCLLLGKERKTLSYHLARETT